MVEALSAPSGTGLTTPVSTGRSEFSNPITSPDFVNVSTSPESIGFSLDTSSPQVSTQEFSTVSDISLFERAFNGSPVEALDPSIPAPEVGTGSHDIHQESDFTSVLTEAKHELDAENAIHAAEDIIKNNQKPFDSPQDEEAGKIVDDIQAFAEGPDITVDDLQMPFFTAEIAETPDLVDILEAQPLPEIRQLPELPADFESVTESEITQGVDSAIKAIESESDLLGTVKSESFLRKVETSPAQALIQTHLDQQKIEEFTKPKTITDIIEKTEVTEESLDEIILAEAVDPTAEAQTRTVAQAKEVVSQLIELKQDPETVIRLVEASLKEQGIQLEDPTVLLPEKKEERGKEEAAVQPSANKTDLTIPKTDQDDEEDKVEKKVKKNQSSFIADQRANALREHEAQRRIKEKFQQKGEVTGAEIVSDLASNQMLKGGVILEGAEDGTLKNIEAAGKALGTFKDESAAMEKIGSIIFNNTAVTVGDSGLGASMEQFENANEGRDTFQAEVPVKIIEKDTNGVTVVPIARSA